MKTQMKAMARPYVTLFGMALIVAVVARIGLGIMDATGALAYDYISASDVAILDTICSILTGSAFVAFMFAASLALTLSVAGVALYAAIARREGGQASAASAFLWGWATALVAIVCLVIVGGGILSAVQVGSMSSKLPGTGVLVVAAIVFAAFSWNAAWCSVYGCRGVRETRENVEACLREPACGVRGVRFGGHGAHGGHVLYAQSREHRYLGARHVVRRRCDCEHRYAACCKPFREISLSLDVA